MKMTPLARIQNVLSSLSWRKARHELLGIVGVALPLLNGYAVLWLLAVQGLLPRVALAPLSEIRDPVFLIPIDWAALLALAVAAATAYLIWWPPFGWAFRADQVGSTSRRQTLFAALALLGGLTLLSGDPVRLLLTAPAALWLWIQPRGRGAGRALNIMLWSGGLLSWLIAGVALAAVLPTPAFLWWHLMAAAAYGLIPAGDVVHWAVLMALGVRFLRFGLSAESLLPR